MEETSLSQNRRVPLTILTGLLGCGKSTLLKHIMKVYHGKKIAVIMNEFGDTQDIEKSLFVHEGALTSQEWLELKNGCICCSIKDTGVRAIESLMERKGTFDFIILETTGLADPQSLISIFWVDDSLFSDIYLDAVITVVDSNACTKNLKDSSLHSIAVKQIALADRILLNKCDLLNENEINEVELAIKEINQTVPIFRTIQSEIDVNQILDIHAYDNKTVKILEDSTKHISPLHFHLDESISTVTLTSTEAINFDRLKQWLAFLLWENLLWDGKPHTMEIWRIKGKLKNAQNNTAIILQGVSELFDLIKTHEVAPEESKVVLIGKNLEKDLLQLSFKSTVFSKM